jgi:hypothetical protein
LPVVNPEILKLHRYRAALHFGLRLDVGHVVEDHLPLLDGAAIELVLRDVAQRKVDPPPPRLVLRMGHDPHLELEPENIHPAHPQFAGGLDSLMHLTLRHRCIDRPDHNERPRFPPVKWGRLERSLSLVGVED